MYTCLEVRNLSSNFELKEKTNKKLFLAGAKIR